MVEFLHRGAVAVEQFQHGAEGRDFGEFGLLLYQRRDAFEAIHHLRVHRVLDPERAVLVESGDAFPGGTKFAPPVVVVAFTKSTMACFAAPSFHEGSGSCAWWW